MTKSKTTETEKKTEQIYHDYLVKDFVNLEKIIIKYLE